MKKPKFRVYFRINKSFYSWKPNIYFNRWLLWKDKFESPRVEMDPKLLISFLWFQLDIIRGNDDDWEWWLWVMKYNGGNENWARKSWPWGKNVEGVFVQSTPWIKYNK